MWIHEDEKASPSNIMYPKDIVTTATGHRWAEVQGTVLLPHLCCVQVANSDDHGGNEI